MALHHSPKTVTDGLILCLDLANPKSYPGTGTVLSDISGNANDATITDGTYDTEGGGNITFNGTTSYIAIDDRVPFTGTSTSSFSFGVWVSPTAAAGNILAMAATTPSGGWNMPPIVCTGQDFRGKVWSNTGLLSVNNFTFGNWYYVALVWNYSVTIGDRVQYLYVNGVLEESQSNITYSSSGVDNYLWLGQANVGADNTGAFTGKMSYFHTYNKSLTQAEISQNFNAMRGRYGI